MCFFRLGKPLRLLLNDRMYPNIKNYLHIIIYRLRYVCCCVVFACTVLVISRGLAMIRCHKEIEEEEINTLAKTFD